MFNKKSGSSVFITEQEQRLWNEYYNALGRVIDAPTDTNVERLRQICETDAYKKLCRALENGISLQHI